MRGRIMVRQRQRCSLLGLLMACSLAASASLIESAAFAKECEGWNVDRKLLGKQKDPDSEPKKSKNVSGVACATGSGFPRICLIVDDETQGTQAVVVDDGEMTAGQFIRLIYDSHDGELVELDAEGVAYSDG